MARSLRSYSASFFFILISFFGIYCASALNFPPLPEGLTQMEAASASNFVALSGGLGAPVPTTSATVFLYDTVTLWSGRVGLSCVRVGHAAGGAMSANGTIIFMSLGGNGTLSDNAPTTVDFIVIPPSPASIPYLVTEQLSSAVAYAGGAGSDYDPSAPLTSGYLVYAGGIDGQGNYHTNLSVYNASSGQWRALPNLSEARADAKVVAGSGFVVVSGGTNAVGVSIAVDVYFFSGTPQTYSMSVGRTLHAMTYRWNTSIALVYIAGGFTDDAHSQVASSVELFAVDPATQVVTSLPNLAIMARARLGAACGLKSCVFAGGETSPNLTTSVIDTFDENNNADTWPNGYPWPVAGAACVASRVTDVIICGGGDDARSPLGFSANITTFGALDRGRVRTLTEAKSALGAAAYGNYIMFFGGCIPGSGFCNATGTVDIITLNGTTDNFTIAQWSDATIPIPRGWMGAAATNNTFMFAGGRNETNVIDSIDLYFPMTTQHSIISFPTAARARWGIASASVDALSLIIFSGGFDISSNGLNYVEVWNCTGLVPVYDSPPLTLGFSVGLTAMVPALDGISYVYILGGQSAIPIASIQIAELIGAVVNVTAGSLRDQYGTFRPRQGIVGFSVGLYRGISAGGNTMNYQSGTSASDRVETHGPFGGTDYRSTSLYVPTAMAAGAGLFTDGIGAVFGGTTDGVNGLNAIQIYDRGHWGQMLLRDNRYGHAVAAASQVFAVAGGKNNANCHFSGMYLDSVEIFPSFLIPRPPPPTTAPPTTMPPPPPCLGSQPVAGAVCINGVWVIPSNNVSTPTTVTVGVNQTVVVNGTLELQPGTVTVITVDPNAGAIPIVVSGTIIVDGTLTIVLTDVATNGLVIPIVGGNGAINGSFTGVTVESPNPQCDNVSGYVQKDASGGISVLITVENKCKSKAFPRGAIAGIVVGAVLLLAAVIAIGVIVLKKHRPDHQLFNTPKTDAGWR